jgi:hypothetical protein
MRFFKHLQIILLILLAFFLTNCFGRSYSVNFQIPANSQGLEKDFLLEKISIKDPYLKRNKFAIKQIDLQLENWFYQNPESSSKFFKPRKKVLLTLLKWEEKEMRNWFFYPFTILTLGGYAFAGGDISSTRFQLIGNWTIYDLSGNLEKKINFNESCIISRNLYTPEKTSRKIASSGSSGIGVECRSTVFHKLFQLLEKGVLELNTGNSNE